MPLSDRPAVADAGHTPLFSPSQSHSESAANAESIESDDVGPLAEPSLSPPRPMMQPQDASPRNTPPRNTPPPRPLRNRVAVTQHTFGSWDLAESLVECQRAGIGAIGLSLPKVRVEGYSRVAEMVDASPIEVSSLNWIAGFTGQNGHRLDDTMDEAYELIRLAARFGAPTVTVITGPQGTHIRNHVTKLFIAKLRELADFADFFRVDLAVLPMTDQHRGAWTFLDTLPRALDVVHAVDRPSVGLAINTAFVWRQRGLPALLRDAAAVTKLVKVSDCSGRPRHANDQRLPGTGRVRTTAIAAALDGAGFRGYYELDVWSEGLWRSGDYARVLESYAGLSFGTRPALAPPSDRPVVA